MSTIADLSAVDN